MKTTGIWLVTGGVNLDDLFDAFDAGGGIVRAEPGASVQFVPGPMLRRSWWTRLKSLFA